MLGVLETALVMGTGVVVCVVMVTITSAALVIWGLEVYDDHKQARAEAQKRAEYKAEADASADRFSIA